MNKQSIAHVSQEKYLYLTTKGRKTGRPHTVELWFALADTRVYLSHEGEYTDWMKNILQDNQVTFRIGGHTFRGKAHIIAKNEVFDKGKKALYHKYYGTACQEVIDDWFSLSTVIEIDPDL